MRNHSHIQMGWAPGSCEGSWASALLLLESCLESRAGSWSSRVGSLPGSPCCSALRVVCASSLWPSALSVGSFTTVPACVVGLSWHLVQS